MTHRCRSGLAARTLPIVEPTLLTKFGQEEGGRAVATPALPQFEKLEDAYVTTVAQIADHYEYVNAPRGNASQSA